MSPLEPIRVPTFVVISGGEIGAAYVRQLLRAEAAGRLLTESIRVVDRDPACPASRFDDRRVRVEAAVWGEWLDAHLEALDRAAHLVPYHWAPHLLREWLERQLAAAGGVTSHGSGVPVMDLPFEASTRGGDRALSYASWVCPPSCIEPALCPHTRGAKDWSLAADLEGAPSLATFDGRIVFRALHLVYGVGTIPVGDILAARDRIVASRGSGPKEWLVATSSHCHALAASLRVLS